MSKSMNGCIELLMDESTGIARICLNNPKKRNAINLQMMEQLSSIITQLENWKTGKAILVYGENGFFSSGIDLSFLAQIINSKESGHYYSSLMVSNLSRLKALPMLSVAVVDGMALGGGAEIAASCDLRVMTRRAKIGFVHIRIGVSSAWGGGCRLVKICGHTKAMDLLLSGKIITSEEALDLGLNNHVLNDPTQSEQVLHHTEEWLKQFIDGEQNKIIEFKSILSVHAH